MRLGFVDSFLAEKRDSQISATIQCQTVIRTEYRFFEANNLATFRFGLAIFSCVIQELGQIVPSIKGAGFCYNWITILNSASAAR